MKTIRQTTIALGLLTLLAIGSCAFMGAFSNRAEADQPHRSGVVVLTAYPDMPNLVVIASSSSQGAPTIPENASLAQALDELLTSGFRIQHTEGSFGLSYTLVR